MKVLYFAWLRERIGAASEDLDLPADIATVGALVEWLKSRGPAHASAFAGDKIVRCAVDQEFAALDAPIAAAREIAFFPPVTGG
jgi:molybdopterin synthase sulfur carrier subunit